MSLNQFLLTLVIVFEVALGISPAADRTTWLLENLPVFIFIPILVIKNDQWKLSPTARIILAIHAFVLMLGGYYTYANVPLGFWAQDLFHFSRNHYDRIGHFMQGFMPTFVLRELLLRFSPLKNGKLLFFVAISMSLAFSAFYEMIEWWSALWLGQGADAFLGTQGDPWDTQWDMFMALVGGVSASLFSWSWNRKSTR